MPTRDLELIRLQEALRSAQQRWARISRSILDPAALRAAEDLYAKALAAVVAYQAKGKLNPDNGPESFAQQDAQQRAVDL
jgi:hypothetical protein